MTSYSPRPFSIRVFLPDGVPDGLRIIEKSNWTGYGVVCPRPLFAEAKARDEFSRTGLYILEGPAESGDMSAVYVGQADVVRSRLEQHHSSKDFWTRAIFFVSKDASLNRAHVQYLEARLIDLAHQAKRAAVDNQNRPQIPNLSEPDQADVESFLQDVLSILPLVGVSAFEKPKRPAGRTALFLSGRGIEARGTEGADEFTVLEGSGATKDETDSIHGFLSRIRQSLAEEGVLVPEGEHYVFTQDYPFNSPSTAAGVALGRNENGRKAWRDAQGRTLREIQSLEAE